MGWNNAIKKELGHCGKNVFIGYNTIFTNPKEVFLGDNVRIDPFCLITAGLKTGNNIQICSHAVLGGGGQQKIILGDWAFIGYGSKLFCASEDYSGEFGPVNEFWGNNKIFRGDITFENYSGIASNVTMLPGITLPEGCTVGANSFIHTKQKLEPWSVYFGNPLELKKKRIKDNVISLSTDKEFLKPSKTKVAKVLCTFFGKRRTSFNTPTDTLGYLIRNIENEIKIDNGVNTDLIIVNNNINRQEKNGILNKYNGVKTKNGEIKILQRENFGGPFGAYYHAFDTFKNEYDYWFFSEDDVLIYKENYMSDFIDFLNSDETIGFVSLAPISTLRKMPEHSGGGAGLTSTEIFSKVYNEATKKQFNDQIRKENSYTLLQEMEITFTNNFIKNGFRLSNHPNFSPICKNYKSVPAHGTYADKINLSKEHIYMVGE